MRFTVSGRWHGRPAEVMWDEGYIQGPRDLLLELRLQAMLVRPSGEDEKIEPMTLLEYVREAFDAVDRVWVDDGGRPMEINGRERLSTAH